MFKPYILFSDGSLKLVNKKAKYFDRAVQCFNMATVWATGSGVNLCSVVSA